MKYCRFILTLLLAVGACAGLATSTTATTITNLTGDTLLFEADYENVSAYGGTWADAVATGNVASIDFDPVATAGSFDVHDGVHYDIQVCNGSTGFDPGPSEGSNYLRIGKRSAFTYTYLNFTPQSTQNDIIRFESMVAYSIQGASQGAGVLGLYGKDASNADVTAMYCLLKGSGGLYDYYENSYIYYKPDGSFTSDENDPAGATLLTVPNQEEWCYLAMDYAVGASSYSLTVGDVTVTGIPASGIATSVTKARLCTGAANSEFVYYDAVSAVPEPSTVALVICGLGALLFVRRR